MPISRRSRELPRALAGEQVGEELVRALMRELGLVTVQPRPYRKTTVRGDDETDVPGGLFIGGKEE
jgi:predicted TPR repeat methyltransferase